MTARTPCWRSYGAREPLRQSHGRAPRRRGERSPPSWLAASWLAAPGLAAPGLAGLPWVVQWQTVVGKCRAQPFAAGLPRRAASHRSRSTDSTGHATRRYAKRVSLCRGARARRCATVAVAVHHVGATNVQPGTAVRARARLAAEQSLEV